MKGITKFFFYYGLLTNTLICLASMLVVQRPYNLIFMFILLPTVMFSWLRFTNPQQATEAEWSTRIFIVITTLLVLFGFSYYFYINSKPQIEKETSEQVSDALIASMSAEIKSLRELIDSDDGKQVLDASDSGSLSKQVIDDLIKSITQPTPSPTPTLTDISTASGNVKVISDSARNIYEKNNTSSRIIGIAEPGNNYIFTQNTPSWYLVEFEDGRMGWIEAKEVVEL